MTDVRIIHHNEADRDVLPEEWQIVMTLDNGKQFVSYALALYKIGQTIMDMANGPEVDDSIQSFEIS